MSDSLPIAVHAFASHVLISVSVDELKKWNELITRSSEDWMRETHSYRGIILFIVFFYTFIFFILCFLN